MVFIRVSMENASIFIIFYQTEDLNINDSEKLIKSELSKDFHLLFFHNKKLHFNKTVILREVLYKKFENIIPDTEYDNENNLIKLTKTLYFNLHEFDKEIDDEYEKYLSKSNYRIDCIFQTFSLFYRIYKNENQIYVFPVQILEKFVKYLNDLKINYHQVAKNNSVFRENKIIKKINENIKYGIDTKNEAGLFMKNTIVKIFQIDHLSA
jgi:hypothetical protein